MKKTIIPFVLLVCSLTIGVKANGGEGLPEPIVKALANMATQESLYAYTRRTQDELGDYVERFDPTLPRESQWTLLRFAGDEPNKKQLDFYRKQYDELFQRDNPTDIDLRDRLDPKTIRVVEQTEDRLHYEFSPLAEDEDDRKVVKHLLGELILDTQENKLLSLQIRSRGKFSPVAMVSIKELSMGLQFASAGENSDVVVVESSSYTRGRFMGLKKFEESERVEFSDFQLVEQ